MSEEDRQASANIVVDHADLDVGSKLLSEAIGSEDRDFPSALSTASLWPLGMAGQLIKAK